MSFVKSKPVGILIFWYAVGVPVEASVPATCSLVIFGRLSTNRIKSTTDMALSSQSESLLERSNLHWKNCISFSFLLCRLKYCHSVCRVLNLYINYYSLIQLTPCPSVAFRLNRPGLKQIVPENSYKPDCNSLK